MPGGRKAPPGGEYVPPAPKRPRGRPPAEGAAAAASTADDDVTCAGCGAECEHDARNWFKKGLVDDRGETPPEGPLCFPCGSYAGTRDLTVKEFLNFVEAKRGKKRLSAEMALERDEHGLSLDNMAGRKFAKCDVERQRISGVYTEDRAGFLDASEFEKCGRKISDTDATLVQRDFPDWQAVPGLLLQPDAVITSIASRTEPGPGPSSASTRTVVRWTAEQIILKETLLDSEKDLFYFYVY